LMWRYKHTARDDVLERLVKRQIEIDHMALRHAHRVAGHRHGRRRDKHIHQRLTCMLRRLPHSLAGDKSQRPDAPPRILERDDSIVLNLSFREEKVGDLLYG